MRRDTKVTLILLRFGPGIFSLSPHLSGREWGSSSGAFASPMNSGVQLLSLVASGHFSGFLASLRMSAQSLPLSRLLFDHESELKQLI
jgi:hypothetical protein